jgi:flagellum-specific peptidoglycan hydrolase FlgJ
VRKIIFIVCIFLVILYIDSPKNKLGYSYANVLPSDEINYIKNYKSYAIFEMVRYKIPASIILAQALIESSAGTSELAKKANNHFAIKCKKNWKGEKYYYDDDYEQECFRSYLTIDDSYTDHSLFLKNSSRYKFLFKLDIKDYKGWCVGLQNAGYATDKNYSNKLIAKIEQYKLYLLDFHPE